jgi:hypothetical protein
MAATVAISSPTRTSTTISATSIAVHLNTARLNTSSATISGHSTARTRSVFAWGTLSWFSLGVLYS